MPLSALSIASLADMGYSVNYEAAQEYTLGGSLLSQQIDYSTLTPKPAVNADTLKAIEAAGTCPYLMNVGAVFVATLRRANSSNDEFQWAKSDYVSRQASGHLGRS